MPRSPRSTRPARSFVRSPRTRFDRIGKALVAMLALPFVVSASALAEPINFFPTGNVQRDLDPARFPNAISPVVILVDNPRFPDDPTNDVAQQRWMTDRGWLTGWNFKEIRFLYDPSTDTMGVGFNFFKNADGSPWNIAGDADGDGDPGRSDPRTLAAGGVDFPDLSGTESITLALDTNRDGIPNIVAGVPANKSGRGIDAFTVAAYKFPQFGTPAGIESSYGDTLPQHLGELAFNPSRDHPDFAFTIRNFSQLPGVIESLPDGTQVFSYNVRAYAGSLDDVVAGEDLFSGFVRNQIIPEPSNYIFWSLAAIGAFTLHQRRQRRRAAAANGAEPAVV